MSNCSHEIPSDELYSRQLVEKIGDEDQNSSWDRSQALVSALDRFEEDNDYQMLTDISSCLIGEKRKNAEELFELYRSHAFELGFSVRRSTTRYNSDKVLVRRLFVCSCEGTKRIAKEGAKRKPYITRTNCKAGLKISLCKDDGMYEVVWHNTEHNHMLTRKKLNYMHRSQRSITADKATAIEGMISSGIRPIDSYRYMAHEAGGEHLIGHTQVDHLNFVNRLKMRAIEAGDAQTLIDILQQSAEEDAEFFFRVKLDEEGKLCNIFWRDGMMMEDYKIFGDVVFDTTYRTNRYNLICAPFVGINNHWKNVMFGCAFIANEKTESFEWLFDVFKRSMCGNAPVTIFTDQDQAIASALENILPTTRHRLCIWHLYQNAISRFGNLKSDKTFNEAFQKILTGCTDAEEFESCWSYMISSYELQGNSWFGRLYSLKEKWSTAYNKKFFSAGILSSQRSESTNSTLCFSAKKTTSLKDFYIIFQSTVHRWRSAEAKDEFQCSRAIPESCIQMTGILKHASEVYTLIMFKVFEQEFLKSIPTSIRLKYEEHDIKIYEVCEDNVQKVHIVNFYMVGNLVSCSCNKFEECGLLCCHCLRIFHVHSVREIPDCYIKNRWKNFCKKDLWDKYDRSADSDKPSKHNWRNKMLRMTYNLLLKAEENVEARLAVEDAFTGVIPVVESLVRSVESERNMEISEQSTSSCAVLDPLRSITKGRKPRIKSHQKGKKSKNKVVTVSKEFGSKTPNGRLF